MTRAVQAQAGREARMHGFSREQGCSTLAVERSGFENARPGGLRSVAACLVMLLAAISTCRAEVSRPDPARAPRAAQPFELVRSLESLQDQIALGTADARAKLPKLIAQIAAVILAAEPGAWADPRNLRAVIVYAASGGQPRAVRAVAELGVARGEMKAVLDGILAYVEGRDTQAKQILVPIEAMTLPVPLAGHVALVQANLVTKEDPRKAMQLLARARVLAPGTLIEEAALRKEIFLADQADDLEAFTSLSSQYVRRFGKSAYAENFRQRFKAAVMRFGLTRDPDRFARLETALEVLEPDEELRLLLATARAGLLAGTIEPARHAIEKAAALARKGTAEASRATLYAAAMRVLTGEIDVGLADLQSLETTGLAKPDTELAEAVQAMASEIRVEPLREQKIGAEPKPGEDALPEGPERRVSESAAAMIERAESVLGEIGTLLEGNGL